MRRLPSIKTLDAAFPGKGKEMRLILEGKRKPSFYESVQSYVLSCHNEPDSDHLMMMALDQVAETHGVEYLGPPQETMDWEPDMEYLNTGDTYATTLIWDNTTGTWKVQSYGDWVEIAERRGYRYD